MKVNLVIPNGLDESNSVTGFKKDVIIFLPLEINGWGINVMVSDDDVEFRDVYSSISNQPLRLPTHMAGCGVVLDAPGFAVAFGAAQYIKLKATSPQLADRLFEVFIG